VAFNDLVEQLAFGSSIPKMDSCLGLFLSPEAIFLCEVGTQNGKPRVLHLLRIPIPTGPVTKDTRMGGSLNTDFLADEERMSGLLQKALSETRWSSKSVRVTLSHHFGILRYFTLPDIERRFWKTAIPTEAKKHIPIPFASLIQDFQTSPLAPGADKKPRLGCLFGVTPIKNLEAIRKLVARIGLNLVGVELAPISSARLLHSISPAGGGEPSAQVHFDDGDIRILVSRGEVPVFYREIFLGPGAPLEDSRKVDIGGCIDFARKQMGITSSIPVRVSGQAADIEGWRALFSQELGTPVTLQELHKPLGLKAGQWGAYAAIGAALRYLIPTSLSLDLSGLGRISDEDRRAVLAIFKLAGTACLLFLCSGAYCSVRLWLQSGRLNSIRRSVSVSEDFRGKKKADIEADIISMRSKVDSFGVMTARQVPLTDILESLTDAVPDALWVTNLVYTNQFDASARRTERTLSITGNAMAPSAATEQDLVFRFAESLRKSAQFIQAFPLIEPSVQRAENSNDSDSSSMDPSTVDANQEKRTRFVIQCAANRTGS
jgi:hypothetical protein